VILGIGVAVVGANVFTALMVEAGDSADHARAMYDSSVMTVVIAAAVVAVLASLGLALLLARMLARPLGEIGAAARRIADGDYAARVPREGPEELASLADSFNQMAASLEEQERMRRDFIANAAHELRTPLTNLQGYLEALRDGVLPPDPATFDSLREEVDRLTRLAASLDVLGGAGVDRGPAREVDVGATVRASADLVGPVLARRSISLTVDAPAGLLVHARADELTQVLANLLQNAVRYTPSGGEIRVTAARAEGGVTVTVANTGPGIPPDDLPRVWERFYRVEKSRDRARGGAGIGLAIVRQLVEDAGGRVGATSEGGWTTFWLTLPGGPARA
jgi:signal transduction histidine kinase